MYYFRIYDPEASNFNVDANLDDESCVPFLSGCTDPDAYNFNPNANWKMVHVIMNH